MVQVVPSLRTSLTPVRVTGCHVFGLVTVIEPVTLKAESLCPVLVTTTE